jgi:hypothetical protein
MRKISISDRIIFLITAHIAGIKIVSGMEHHSVLSTSAYTIAFGVLVLASIMLLLFGFILLENPFMPVISTLIPMMLSLGLVQDHIPGMIKSYTLLISVLYLISIYARFRATPKTAALVLAIVHGVSGLLLVVMPLVLYFVYGLPARILFIGLAGLVIGVEGSLLAVQKLNFIKIDQNRILAFLPGMVLISTAGFVAGLNIN